MLEIDGAKGEGGGQILRTALSLSLVCNKPFKITNIRANRSKPGLMRQHLTAVNAAAEVGGAKVYGAQLGSRILQFEPLAIKPGNYEFAVDTAGSTTLVFQTVLPALATAKAGSLVKISGGTHNTHAPPFDFLEKTYLPLLRQMGWEVNFTLERPGFYPSGGGEINAQIYPAQSFTPLHLNFRGDIQRIWAKAIISALPEHIAEREIKVIQKMLDLDRRFLSIDKLGDDYGPGNAVIIGVESSQLTEVFCGFGERGKRAEHVAKEAANQATKYLASNSPVGPYLADQLLLPIALIGSGEFETLELTDHFHTNIAIIKQFLDINVELKQLESNHFRVRISS